MRTSPFRSLTALVALLSLVTLTGCQSAPKRDPAYAASLPPAYPEPQQRATGSIYQPGYDLVLFEDIKARHVGDILTIRLVERTDASKKAATNSERDSSTTVENPTILGVSPQFSVPGMLPLTGTTNLSLETNLAASNEFEGKGDSSQSNSLTGDISVTVAEVLPNGNMIVRGEKRINLNQGNEYVQINGIVRPVDIGPDNVVISTKVADATLVYKGEGQIADSNRMGWLARFFNSALFPL